MYLGHPLSANRICLYLFLENESPVWIYFAKEPGDDVVWAICKFEKDDSGKTCDYSIEVTKQSSKISCMKKHLKNHHKKGIKAVEEERKKQKGVGTSDEAQEEHKCNILIIVYY